MLKTKLLIPIVALLATASCSPSSVHFLDSSRSTSTSSYKNHTSYRTYMLNSPKKAFNDGNDVSTPSSAYVDSLNNLSNSSMPIYSFSKPYGFALYKLYQKLKT